MLFRDISPVLADPAAFRVLTDALVAGLPPAPRPWWPSRPAVFILGAAVAYAAGRRPSLRAQAGQAAGRAASRELLAGVRHRHPGAAGGHHPAGTTSGDHGRRAGHRRDRGGHSGAGRARRGRGGGRVRDPGAGAASRPPTAFPAWTSPPCLRPDRWQARPATVKRETISHMWRGCRRDSPGFWHGSARRPAVTSAAEVETAFTVSTGTLVAISAAGGTPGLRVPRLELARAPQSQRSSSASGISAPPGRRADS